MSNQCKSKQNRKHYPLLFLLSALIVSVFLACQTEQRMNVAVQITARSTEDPLISIKRTIERDARVRVFSIKKPKTHILVEYDLKPKFMWPNEIIHDENVLEMVCALRRHRQIKDSFTFRGMGRFRNDAGKLVHKLSVLSSFTPAAMNRIGCDSGRNAQDVNWKILSTYYRSYPIPDGMKVDT